MASLKFYQYKETDGNTMIFMTFTFNHERLRLSSGLSIPAKAWDTETQRAKPAKDFVECNRKLREISKFLFDKYDELFPHKSVFNKDIVKRKAAELKHAYQVYLGRKEEVIAPRTTLQSFIAVFQDRYKNKFNKGYLRHYDGLKTHLDEFQSKHDFNVDFDTIGKEFYIKFTDYLQEQGLKPNTIGGHIKRIKRLMNEAVEDNLTTNQAHKKKDFKVTREEVDTIYLTENDIKLLYEMPIENDSKRKIRDVFVLNCYTGLRHSDWDKVSIDALDNGKLKIPTQKTKTAVLIPVKPLVMEILQRYKRIEAPTLQKTNEALRWIGEKAYDQKLGNGNIKKWLEIRTHTARRSFATNAYIAGIPERAIMQITGHKTSESFQKYIRFTKQETAEKFKDHAFFS